MISAIQAELGRNKAVHGAVPPSAMPRAHEGYNFSFMASMPPRRHRRHGQHDDLPILTTN